MSIRSRFRRALGLIPCLLCLATLCLASAANPTSGGPAQSRDSASRQSTAVVSYSLPPAQLRKSEALYRTRTVLYPAGTAYEIAILAALLALRIAPRYRSLAERLARRHLLQAAIFIPLLLITCDLLLLAKSAEGEKIGISRPCPYKINLAQGRARFVIGGGKRALEFLPRFVLLPSQEAVGDGAFQDPFPKTPPQHGIADTLAEALAI